MLPAATNCSRETFRETLIKTENYFPAGFLLGQTELLEISLIKVTTDIPFITHFIPAWPCIFIIIMAHMIAQYTALT